MFLVLKKVWYKGNWNKLFLILKVFKISGLYLVELNRLLIVCKSKKRKII